MKIAVLSIFYLVLSTGAKDITEVSQSSDGQLGQFGTKTNIPNLDKRIIGGLLARIEEFPYQVSIIKSNRHTCGGSIIETNVIITAAHCVEGKRPKQLTIRAGSNQHNQRGITVDVKKITVHPNYIPSTLDRDVALLLLSNNLTFGATIRSIELATSKDILKDKAPLLVSGWGATTEGSGSSLFLRSTQVRLINQKICAKSYSRSGQITSNMLCAGGAGRDSCQGDSGGPLISNDTNKLHGIVSWGYGCARPQYPGVYTKVANMNSWVQKQLKLVKH